MAKWCKENNIPYFTYRKLFSINPVVGMHIRWICQRLKISHVHVHDSHSHTFAVLAASLFGNRVPIIIHRRVDFPIGQSKLSLWKYNHKKVGAIICVSNFVRELIIPKLKNPDLAKVVHDGVDLKKNKKVKHSKKSAHAKLRIGNVAAIAPHKDYFTFVRTAENLLNDDLDAHFLIIGGDGGEEVAVRNLIAERGLSEDIEMMGFRKDVLKLLSNLDLLLFTSKTEGLGSTLLDAMCLGVPIVATEAGGIPEIIDHEKTGLLAPVGDAEKLAAQVQRILNDNELRKDILSNSKKKVIGFSKKNMAKETLKIYQEI